MDDVRTWRETDRPGESISVSKALPGVEVVSVKGSTRHWCEAHSGFTLALIHRAQAGLRVGWRTRNRTLSSEAGGIMAFEPGDVHVTQRLSQSTGASFDAVKIAPEMVSRVAEELGVRGEFHFSAPALSDAPTYDACSAFVQALANGGDAFEVDCAWSASVQSLVERLGEAPTPSGRALDPIRDYRLRDVREYIRVRHDRLPKLSELEQIAGLRRWRLCTVFKRAYGVTIGTYRNAVRLDESVRRLQRGVPIKFIVSELGFSDESHFSRLFKAQYGIPPGAWVTLWRANDWRRNRK